MKLTNEIIEQNGFKRINNSMFRFENITLQNTHTNSGETFIERILSTEKAYKVCVNGKWVCDITKLDELKKAKLLVAYK